MQESWGTLDIYLFVNVSLICIRVRINDDVARREQKRVVFGSIATIKGLSEWANEQIVDMAFVAHDDMRAQHKSIDFASTYPGHSAKVPGVTTTLVVDDTAYISSSMGGGPYLYVPNGQKTGSRFTELDPLRPRGAVQDALTRCQVNSINLSGHRTGASCGEPMAALAFCATHNQRSLINAKVVTITGKSTYKIVPPCGDLKGELVSPTCFRAYRFFLFRILNELLMYKTVICR
jgi:hypothetical protein